MTETEILAILNRFDLSTDKMRALNNDICLDYEGFGENYIYSTYVDDIYDLFLSDKESAKRFIQNLIYSTNSYNPENNFQFGACNYFHYDVYEHMHKVDEDYTSILNYLIDTIQTFNLNADDLNTYLANYIDTEN